MKCHKKFGINLFKVYPNIWCKCGGLLKPNIVFYGEQLSINYFDSLKEDCLKADLLLVLGSSLSVKPINQILFQIGKEITKICVNRSKPKYHEQFDYLIYSDLETALESVKIF